jgi:hypothetical protein
MEVDASRATRRAGATALPPAAESLTISFAGDAADHRDARAVRDAVYHARLGLVPSEWDDDFRDEHSIVPVLRASGVPVASTRLLPASSAHGELLQLGRRPLWAPFQYGLVEVSRVAAVKRAGGIPYGTLMFFMGTPWLLSRTTIRRYIGAVRLSVAPLYEMFGGRTSGAPFRIPDRSDAEYVLVYGSFARMARIAEEMVGEAFTIDGDVVRATI